MGALSPAHLLFVLVIALLVLGPGKLPDTGAALGRALREFRKAVQGDDEPATTGIPSVGAPPDAASRSDATPPSGDTPD